MHKSTLNWLRNLRLRVEVLCSFLLKESLVEVLILQVEILSHRLNRCLILAYKLLRLNKLGLSLWLLKNLSKLLICLDMASLWIYLLVCKLIILGRSIIVLLHVALVVYMMRLLLNLHRLLLILHRRLLLSYPMWLG